MVQALRDLAMEFQMDFVHFTEQAHHNKDEVDGEFSRFKDAIISVDIIQMMRATLRC